MRRAEVLYGTKNAMKPVVCVDEGQSEKGDDGSEELFRVYTVVYMLLCIDLVGGAGRVCVIGV